jgi:hypothetical protein
MDIAHGVFSILVKATGDNVSIPGHYTGMPHFPAFILMFIFDLYISLHCGYIG